MAGDGPTIGLAPGRASKVSKSTEGAPARRPPSRRHLPQLTMPSGRWRHPRPRVRLSTNARGLTIAISRKSGPSKLDPRYGRGDSGARRRWSPVARAKPLVVTYSERLL